MSEIIKAGENLFRELGFPPHEAEVLRMRSDLMAELRLWLRDEGLAEAGAAERLGISLDKATHLIQGKWRSFGTEDLLALAAKAGMRVRIEFERTA